MEYLGNNRVLLCCGKGRCPIVEKTDYGFEITDDFGGKVKLTSDQLAMIKDVEKTINDNN